MTLRERGGGEGSALNVNLTLSVIRSIFRRPLTKDQNVHSLLLSSVHLRSAKLQLSRWEKDWSLVSDSVNV